jgi:hypothetical protein
MLAINNDKTRFMMKSYFHAISEVWVCLVAMLLKLKLVSRVAKVII